MTKNVSRRGFLSILGGAAALPLTGLAAEAALPPVEVYDCFTSYTGYHTFGKHSGMAFSEMITHTLREHAPLIEQNISKSNALYYKLKKKKCQA